VELFRLVGNIFVENEDANDNINETNTNAQGLGGSFSKLSSLAAVAGTAIVAVGAAAAAAAIAIGVKAVMAADDLKKSLNTLQTQTGSTDQEMSKLKDGMLELYGQNFGESFDDIAKSMAIVKQQSEALGIQTEKDITNTTKNALILRDAFEMDVTESVKAASSMVSQFGITSNEAYNLIAQGAQNGANKNGDLLDILNEYSPQFSAMGFTANEFTDTLISGAEGGAFSIDKVGDAMKEFTIRSKDGSKASMEAFKELGFNAEKMTSDFAKGGKTAHDSFMKVNEALLKTEDPVKRNQIGVALWGTMYEDLETKGISAIVNITDKADMSKNTMDEINNIKYDSFGEALTGIGRQLEVALLIPLGEKILPVLNTFANWFSSNIPVLIEKINTFTSKFKTLVDLFVTGDFDTIKEKFKSMLPPELSGGIELVVGFYEKLRNGLIALGEILRPVGEMFKETFSKLDFSIILESYSKFIEALKPLQPAIEALGVLIGGILVTAFSLVVGLLNGIISVIPNVYSNIYSLYTVFASVMGLIIGVFSGDGSKILESVTNLWEAIKSIFENTIMIVVNFVKGFGTGVITVFQGLYDTLVGHSIIPDMVNAIIKLFTDMKDKAIGLVTNIKDKIVEIWTSAKDKAIEVVTNIKSKIIEIWTSIKTSISEKLNNIKTTVTTVFNEIKTVASNTWNNIKTNITTIINSIKSTVSSVFNSIKSTVSSVFTSIKSTVTSIWNSIKSSITNIVNSIKSTAINAFNSLKSGVATAISSMVSTITSKLNGLKSIFDSVAGWANSLKDNISSLISKIGSIPSKVGEFVPGMATGGIVREPFTLVGEEGPEIVKLPYGAQVIPNKESMSMIGTPNNSTIDNFRNAEVQQVTKEIIIENIINLDGRKVSENTSRYQYNDNNSKFRSLGATI